MTEQEYEVLMSDAEIAYIRHAECGDPYAFTKAFEYAEKRVKPPFKTEVKELE